ncbi:type II secretion system protein [Thiomicrorhabdus xiamenensis]|uniref:Prepilin-type N-terminal cleavage/methylation domain-containing protein n=1 Tax=Thiomicrorhabdus xiamenensis TaxID=2739063 RepID=A0A7D4NJR3_9GAMM|nr:type II secretion system protein [Thiomicrorhabdus xiamenensis]QKI88549.1 prepilin-type N-terminal cleavage/methylation domain-containing protein [Thiomicrorhabdus xiamenensis]
MNKRLIKGFSLLEMAIALVVLGILIMSFNTVFKLVFDTDHRVQQIYESQKVQDALETFLAVNSRLPCPDTDDDGYEEFNGLVCSSAEGGLPYNELGIKEWDAWGNLYFYRIISSAANPAGYTNQVCHAASVFGVSGAIDSTDLKICTSTNEVVCDATPDSALCNGGSWDAATVNGDYPPYFSIYTPPANDALTVTADNGDIEDSNVVAVAISWGANGDEAYYYNAANKQCPGSLSANEQENCDGTNTTFVKTTIGLDRDYVIPITLDQAKKAVIASRRFK